MLPQRQLHGNKQMNHFCHYCQLESSVLTVVQIVENQYLEKYNCSYINATGKEDSERIGKILIFRYSC